MTHIAPQFNRRWGRAQAVGLFVLAIAMILGGCATRPIVVSAPAAPDPSPPTAPAPSQPTAPAAVPAPTPQLAAARKARFTPTEFARLPGWANDDLSGLSKALKRQCGNSQAPDGSSGQLGLQVTCRLAATMPQELAELRGWLEERFMPWAIESVGATEGSEAATGGPATSGVTATPPSFEGLITGYYEPLLRGSRERSERFVIPIRGRPDDLIILDLGSVYPETKNLRMRGRLVASAKGPPRVVPYGDRTEIENQTPVKPLAWVDDPVDAFFLEIQGSGRVRLEDGSVLRVGYSDQNGRPYYPIGRELIRRGALQAGSATAPAIRDWLRTHPDEARSVMATNPSFVFFRELPPPREADEGPLGALGVALTPTRSAAIDPKALPLGTMLYVSTNHPGREGALERLVIAQDTGGAIRGPVRADFFWGFDAVDGQSAADLAGRMRSPGRLWLLWPRGETPPQPPRTLNL